MLQQIRDKTSGIVAGFIVAIIAVPFAFWGIDSFNSGGGDPVIAKVGDQKIHESQFRAAYQNRYQQMQALMGENFRADQFDQARFRQSVLDDMTQESVMRQFTRDAGYRANDALLFAYIEQIPAFQKDGKFDTQAYKDALRNQGMTPEGFEQQLRDSIEIDQMREAVIETAFVTDNEARAAWRLANQQRTIAYALFPAAKYLPQVTVSDDEIKARYERDKARFQAPERIKLAYVELSQDALPRPETPSDEVLKVAYEAEKASRFTTPEERTASHILVAFGADKDAAKKKIDGLVAQLKAGAKFEDLARAHSDDPGSKDQGGSLGAVRRGQMTEKFEQALYDLKTAGQVSEPVETEFGWHLIRLDQYAPSTVRPFEDPTVRQELIELNQNRMLAQLFGEMSDKLETLAFENPTSLDAVAKDLNLTVQTTDWFSRAGGSGIAANEAVKAAAFSREVLTDNENSKPLPLGPGRSVVVRKAEYEAPRQRTLEEVADTLRTELLAEAAKAKVQADATALLEDVKAGKPLDQAASARGAELRKPDPVKRDATTEDRAVIDAAFKLPRPTPEQPQFGQATLANGDIAVIALSEVQDAEWPPADSSAGQRQRQRLRDQHAGIEFGGYRKSLEKTIEVEIVKAPEAEAPETAP